MENIPGWGVKLQTEVETLQTAFTQHVTQNRQTHQELFQRTERPSWAVTVVLSILSSLVVGLAVFTATHI